jgi:AraC-like DNA-binding protein
MSDLAQNSVEISQSAVQKRVKKVRKELSVLEKEHQVVKLRTNGKTFQEIADQLDYADPSGAYLAWQRAISRYPSEAVDEHRKIHLARLEALIGILWPKIEAGDLAAVQPFLAAMKREAEMLGIDAPKESKVEVTTYDGDLLRERARQIIQIVREHSDQESRVGSDPSST